MRRRVVAVVLAVSESENTDDMIVWSTYDRIWSEKCDFKATRSTKWSRIFAELVRGALMHPKVQQVPQHFQDQPRRMRLSSDLMGSCALFLHHANIITSALDHFRFSTSLLPRFKVTQSKFIRKSTRFYCCCHNAIWWIILGVYGGVRTTYVWSILICE